MSEEAQWLQDAACDVECEIADQAHNHCVSSAAELAAIADANIGSGCIYWDMPILGLNYGHQLNETCPVFLTVVERGSGAEAFRK